MNRQITNNIRRVNLTERDSPRVKMNHLVRKFCGLKHKHHKKKWEDLRPYLQSTKDGRVKKLENFGDYVVRQLGIKADKAKHWLSKLANDYLRESRSESNRIRGHIFECLSGLCSEDEIDSLYMQLIREFEACMLSYFAFHWDHSSVIINQVLQGSSPPEKKMQAAILSVIRKLRLKRVFKALQTKNIFSILLKELNTIGKYLPHPHESNIDKHLPHPHESNIDKHLPHSHESNIVVCTNANERCPVLLLVGGGMGAGKSSVIRDVLKCTTENAVIVEADAFKETDLIYQALISSGCGDVLETAELVHKTSTDAASSLLVAALNEGLDIIFDGTMSWEPFVKQTIEMARAIHLRRYRMGPGYQVNNDGHVHEKYWEPVDEYNSMPKPESLEESTKEDYFSEATGCTETLLKSTQSRKPYRIELIGVICDPYIAVFRGFRRAILTRRAVRIRNQLHSHKMFGNALENYCELVDHVRLYCTNKGQAKLIGVKESNSKLQVKREGKCTLRKLNLLDPNAQSILELYNQPNERNELDEFWKDVMASDRFSQQEKLQNMIQRVERLLLG